MKPKAKPVIAYGTAIKDMETGKLYLISTGERLEKCPKNVKLVRVIVREVKDAR